MDGAFSSFARINQSVGAGWRLPPRSDSHGDSAQKQEPQEFSDGQGPLREELLDPPRSARPGPQILVPTVLVLRQKVEFLIELLQFLRIRKKLWLLPLILVLLGIGALLVIVQGSAFAPFIYTLF